MRILNVVELIDGQISIESFVIHENENAAIEAAEELFMLKAKENGATDDEIDSMVEAMEFGGDDYGCYMVWSTVNE